MTEATAAWAYLRLWGGNRHGPPLVPRSTLEPLPSIRASPRLPQGTRLSAVPGSLHRALVDVFSLDGRLCRHYGNARANIKASDSVSRMDHWNLTSLGSASRSRTRGHGGLRPALPRGRVRNPQGAMGRPFGDSLIHECASKRYPVAVIVEHRAPYPTACRECWGQPVALIGGPRSALDQPSISESAKTNSPNPARPRESPPHR